MYRIAFPAVIALLLGLSCSKKTSLAVSDSQINDKEILILISLDGFRYDYFENADTPALDQLASKGVKAKGLIPVFPTKTFPNHYSQVTGLYPQNHGIIGNTMYDPEFDEVFTLSNGATKDGKWYEGEPIWVTAEKQGVKTATYFWPGSDAEISGTRPSMYEAFDANVSYSARTRKVLNWLTLPAETRPNFITLYFQSPDTEGHEGGPNSSLAKIGIELVDRQIGDLVRGIEDQGMTDKVNIIIVSDHGMAQLCREQVIFLDDYIKLSDVRIINWSPIAEFIPDEGRETEVLQALTDAHSHMRVFKKEEMPEELHYNNHKRIPPIICIADEGWSISDHRFFDANPNSYTGGAHGFDPKHSSMWGIFLAKGPSFKTNQHIEAFENIHLYELMCKVLGIEPAANDGKLTELSGVLTQ